MENRSYLESGIYIDREYTSDIEYRRKLLQLILRAARNHDDYRGRCRMDRDKLVILGRNYGLHMQGYTRRHTYNQLQVRPDYGKQ